MSAKTWGPFNGRQLTTIICISIVTVLLPVAAWSATASHVVVDSGKVTVATPVAANVAQRSQFISSGAIKTSVNPTVLITPPAGKGLVITTFHASFENATPGSSWLYMFIGSPTTCTGGTDFVEWDFASADGTIDAPFVPGYVVPPGKVLCYQHGGTAFSTWINAYGYIVAPGDARTQSLKTTATPMLNHR